MAANNEVVLIAEATALPGKHDDLRHAFDILVRQTRAEEGVNAFILHEARDKPGHFMLYEVYRDQSAVEAHFATAHFGAIVKALAEFAEGGVPRLTYYTETGS
ncbi:MAG TPA: putative quinol monooxygenase [Mycobacterium sp.]|uniref:putative quinol monooxygenase n=1 Tax=Mycobacterium sp. TaxID=1785 RepID=UPI002B782615|nr:putative quinol monooxygenase [Mycobacterium sp.]HXO82973.1 putative quinol monooxygenase [Mycobacterium sp.]